MFSTRKIMHFLNVVRSHDLRKVAQDKKHSGGKQDDHKRDLCIALYECNFNVSRPCRVRGEVDAKLRNYSIVIHTYVA